MVVNNRLVFKELAPEESSGAIDMAEQAHRTVVHERLLRDRSNERYRRPDKR
jgi:hypothetical protein